MIILWSLFKFVFESSKNIDIFYLVPLWSIQIIIQSIILTLLFFIFTLAITCDYSYINICIIMNYTDSIK